jgi:hypothetical protein
MEFSAKIKAAVPPEMEFVYDRRLTTDYLMCEAVSDDCAMCPWNVYDYGCASAHGLPKDERALACCFMQAIAELGTNY